MQTAFNDEYKRDHRQEEIAVRLKQKDPASTTILNFRVFYSSNVHSEEECRKKHTNDA